MPYISRQQNNQLFGPTVGDKIRLGNTDLYIEIEKDLRVYGDEVVYGGGKTLRDGMGLANEITSKDGSLDLVITNVTILDPILGVVKADVGVKDGKIAGIGKSGNPNIMHNVDPNLVQVLLRMLSLASIAFLQLLVLTVMCIMFHPSRLITAFQMVSPHL